MPTRRSPASLPPGLLVRLGKTVWHGIWQTMMGQLAPSDQQGSYVRPPSQFRADFTADQYPPASGRYHLIVGMGCPWAHRTLVVRALKGLEAVLPLWVVVPSTDEGRWVFPTDTPQVETAAGETEDWRSLPDLYQTAQPGYRGRSTVPVLWDTETRTIVNNESLDIIKLLNQDLNPWAQRPEVDLYPAANREAIDGWIERNYHAINNGVYRCGFARTQTAYEAAATLLFDTLAAIDDHLGQQRYLCGKQPTLADVCLFTTLARFDAAYHGLFKCDRRRLRDYPNLWPYARDLYQQPGVAATCDFDTIRRDYYGNLFPLNPGGLIPLGPDPADWHHSHDRV
jgi:putative glutathione S-transferase